jgi:hypothetical protein
LWTLCGMTYIACITFIEVPEKNLRFADTVLGFLIGSAFTVIIKAYFDTSKSTQQKDEALAEIAKMPVVTSFPQSGSETVVNNATAATPGATK